MITKRAGTAVVVTTPAKLNLFLEILRRRKDGFHEIETLMRTIAWRDTIVFSPRDRDGISLDCRWAEGIEAKRNSRDSRYRNIYSDLPLDEDNLVLRAARMVQEASGISLGANIRLRKRIPSAAGLGGASSDAAATIAAANIAWNLHWPETRLKEIAAQIGSDVPFFLGDRMAICRGRGEAIDPVERDRQRYHVIVKPVGGLSTAAVYRACKVPENPLRLENGSHRKPSYQHVELNRLTEPAYELAPQLKQLSEELERIAGSPAAMSGSGTSHFVPCRNVKHARRVAAHASARRLGAVCCSVT